MSPFYAPDVHCPRSRQASLSKQNNVNASSCPPFGLSSFFHPHASLEALPTEVQVAIISDLSLWDQMRLRVTNRTFHNLIDPPSFDEIFRMERQQRDYMSNSQRFYACGYCLRLRPKDKFAPPMIAYLGQGKRYRSHEKWWVHGVLERRPEYTRPHASKKVKGRFCIECGPRPMTAADTTTRYRGDTWEEGGVPFTRCLRCGRCAEAWKQNRSMCLECRDKLDAQYTRPAISEDIDQGHGEAHGQDIGR